MSYIELWVMELLKHERIKPFDDYINRLVHNLELDDNEKSELEEEWKQHLYDHFAALRKQYIEREKAIQIVIEQFGDIQMLQTEVNDTYPNSIKNHVQKEVIIAILCVIASLIGPFILIGAHYQAYFILASLQSLIFAYVIHRFIIKRQNDWKLSLIGFIVIYIVFLQLLPQIYGTSLSFQLYFSQLFSLDWNRLTGFNGLFEFVTIQMMWYVIVAFQFMTIDNYIPVWKRILNASFQFWAMVLIGLFLARYQSSAESSVILLNVFLLYSFLQQTISIKRITIFREKVSRMLFRQTL